MKFRLTIDSEDAEATEAPRLLVGCALKQVAKTMDNSEIVAGAIILDRNGNQIGSWELTE